MGDARSITVDLAAAGVPPAMRYDRRVLAAMASLPQVGAADVTRFANFFALPMVPARAPADPIGGPGAGGLPVPPGRG